MSDAAPLEKPFLLTRQPDLLTGDDGSATPAGVVSLRLRGVRFLFDRADLGHMVGFQVDRPDEAGGETGGAATVLTHMVGLAGDPAAHPDGHPVVVDVSSRRELWRGVGHLALLGRLRASFPGSAWAAELLDVLDRMSATDDGFSPEMAELVRQGGLTFPAQPDEWGGPIDQRSLSEMAGRWDKEWQEWQNSDRSGDSPAPGLEPRRASEVLMAVPEHPGTWIARLAARDDGHEVATSIVESWAILAVESARRARSEGTTITEWWTASRLWWQATVAGWEALSRGDAWAGECAEVAAAHLAAVARVTDPEDRTIDIPTDPGPTFAFDGAAGAALVDVR